MKAFIAAAAFILFLSYGNALAAYNVKTLSDVNLRADKKTTGKALSIIKANVELTVLEEDEIWAKVSADNGKQGWINKKFLTKTAIRPAESEKIENVQDSGPSAEEEDIHDRVSSEISTLQEEETDPVQAVKNLKNQIEDLSMQLEALKKESAELQTVKPEYEKALEEIKNLDATVDDLDKKLLSKGIYWFLAGAGVFLFGWFLGRSARNRNHYY